MTMAGTAGSADNGEAGGAEGRAEGVKAAEQSGEGLPVARRARVAIVHTREKHRSPERVEALVEEALGHLGGMSAFVAPGQTVLIKPNQTVFYSAEEGCTTDPLVVGALIRLAKRGGAAKVQVGESSGDFFNSIQCMHITGM